MWCWCSTHLTTSMPWVSSWVSGQVAYFGFQVGSGDWLGVPCTQLMYWLGDNFTINFTVKCMFSFLISVLADEDILKLVLECLDLMVSSWKRIILPTPKTMYCQVVQWGWGRRPGYWTQGSQERGWSSCSCSSRGSCSCSVGASTICWWGFGTEESFKVGQAVGFSSSLRGRPSWGCSGKGGCWGPLPVACCS